LPTGCDGPVDILLTVVDEQAGCGLQIKVFYMGVVDPPVRFDHPDLTRHGNAAWNLQERENFARLLECVGGDVGQHGHVAPLLDQVEHDIDAVIVGMADHFVPVLAKSPDQLGLVRVIGDQQRLGFLPSASAVLLEVSFIGTDSLEERLALRLIRDQPAVGNFRIVMDQDLADIEYDVPNWVAYWLAHALVCLAHLLPLLNNAGKAALSAFFMTVGSASPGSE